MAQAKGNKKSLTGDRGTADDLEVLQLIITSNQGLMARVMDKIKQARNLANVRNSGNNTLSVQKPSQGTNQNRE